MTDQPPIENHENARSSNRFVVVFGIIMIVGLVGLAWLGQNPRPNVIGERLPMIDLQPLLNAHEVSNQSIEGKVAVLHFWGTWCGPCIKEFPEFAELCAKFSDNADVELISISCSGGVEYDIPKLERTTEQFLEKFPGTIPTYSDSAAMTRQQLSLILGGSFGLPTTIVVGKDGRIVEALVGSLPGDMPKLEKKIAALL